MAQTLFVGNLNWQATNDDLQAKFSEFGEVESAVVILDKETRRSRGFGFVTFVNDADAEKAIEATDGQEFMGREMKVNVAQPRD